MPTEKLKEVELGAIWSRAKGYWFSSPIEADRLSDLFLFANEQPIKIMVRPNENKRSEKSPDGFIVAIKA